MDTETTIADEVAHQPRLEDERLLRGHGRFVADPVMNSQAYACFVRSPHAFAYIRSVDTTAARAASGVLAVLTGSDTEDLGNVSQHPPLGGRGGSKLIVPHRPALARTTVRHVGEAVAMVVADSFIEAQDAAELVHVEYE